MLSHLNSWANDLKDSLWVQWDTLPRRLWICYQTYNWLMTSGLEKRPTWLWRTRPQPVERVICADRVLKTWRQHVHVTHDIMVNTLVPGWARTTNLSVNSRTRWPIAPQRLTFVGCGRGLYHYRPLSLHSSVCSIPACLPWGWYLLCR